MILYNWFVLSGDTFSPLVVRVPNPNISLLPVPMKHASGITLFYMDILFGKNFVSKLVIYCFNFFLSLTNITLVTRYRWHATISIAFTVRSSYTLRLFHFSLKLLWRLLSSPGCRRTKFSKNNKSSRCKEKVSAGNIRSDSFKLTCSSLFGLLHKRKK